MSNLQDLKTNYGYLFEEELLQEISDIGTYKEVHENEILIDVGQYITAMPLLINGAVKILRDDENGDELLLYFLEKGDTCAMTLSCCMGQSKSEIRAVSELNTQLIMIPITKMEEWTITYKSWRDFVFKSYHNRLMEMLNTIDSIAFLKMDERLIKYLKNKSEVNNSSIIKSTHQDIAFELHSSRVVISRLLKKLENQNKIKLNRNSIEIIAL
ncbi:MAG: Crp/Fnr family transcriptional regulator [Flavobacteriaceae bacterium]